MKKLVFICMIFILATACMNKQGDTPASSQKVKVITASVTKVPGDIELSYSGTVEASQTIPLTFQINGTVENVLVDAGDQVRKGQLLATLDASDVKSIYATMMSKYNLAQDAYDRLKSVHEKGSLPEIRWMEMKSDLDQAKAALELAKNNLEKTKMVAPVDGIVGRRNIEPGQSSLSLTTAPIELVRIEKVFIRISVPENELNKIEKGRKASVTVLAINSAPFEGTITNVSPVAELMSRTYTVKVSVDNPGFQLKPGMVCDVTIPSGKGGTMLVVPYQAVKKDPEGNRFVFVVNPGRTSVGKTIVRTGNYHGNYIEITGGLTEGQTIVTAGADRLSDNSLIEL